MLRFVLLVLAVAVQSGLSYRSVCYHTNWSQYRHSKGHFVPSNIDPNLCTHIIYAFAKVVGNDVVAFEWNDESTPWSTGMYEKMMSLKNQNPSLKIMLGVGGWNMGSGPFMAIVDNDADRKTFAQNVVNFLRKHGFDGFDNDWEYPGSRGSPAQDKQNNVLMMQEVRRAMDADEARGGSHLFLSEAIGVGKGTIDAGYDFNALAQVVDFFNVMTYDIHGAFDKFTGHNAPIYPHTAETGDARHFNIDWATTYLQQQGMPAHKINLGIPTYGRSFTMDNPSNHDVGVPASHPGREGKYTGEAGFISYFEICERLQSGHAQVYTIQSQHAKYIVDGAEWIGFDDVDSVTEKACYAKQHGFGGVMYWALDLDDFSGSTCGQGTYPLINAANNEFKNPSLASCNRTPGPVQPTPAPVTQAPYTPQPATYAPWTPAPVTPAPWTPAPVTPAPATYAPWTPAPITQGPAVTASPLISQTGNFNCVGKINDFYADPSSCYSFYICASQNAFKVDCAKGLLFNAKVKHCDWAYNVQCGFNQPQIPAQYTNPPAQTRPPVRVTPAPTRAPVIPTRAPTQPTRAPYVAPVTPAPATPAPATAAPANPASPICDKTTSGIFPHPGDCSKYVQCSLGRKFEMTCPSHLVFNPALGSCDFLVNVPSCFQG